MRHAIILAAMAALAAEASAQPSPFDMSQEGPPPATERQPPKPQPQPSTPAPAAADATAETPPAAADRVGSAVDTRRYLVPGSSLTLAGETARRRWSVFLTDVEADSAETLQIAYQSSILVAPEASTLRVVVNGQSVIDAPVASPDAVSEISVDVPAGLLQAGLNTIALEAYMRHRTDCTIQSTYDLWAEFYGERSFVSFADGADTAPRALDDTRAVGFDEAGQTRFEIAVAPGSLVQASRWVPGLSQGLALFAATPNQVVTVAEGSPAPAAPGSLSVMLGTADELAPLIANFPEQARQGTYAGFVPGSEGRSVLILSGPDWTAVAAAVERLIAPVDRPVSVPRTEIANPGWLNPNPPLLFSGASIPFRNLGLVTQEFSGRRFRTELAIAVPADFYAESYGEATLLLDLAYTSAVRPGSTLDVYVNGNIATTIPIGSPSGEVLRGYPASVTLRHLRPGVNTIAIEAIIDAEADAACLAGTSTGTDTRFVLFDSSSFQMPDFARISTRPSLSALSGTGFPYSRVETPTPMILGDPSAPTLSAAATFAARIATAAGREIPFDTTLPAAAATGNEAVFIGPAPRLPAGILPLANVSDGLRTGWSTATVAPEASGSSNTSIEAWSERVSSPWERGMNAIEDWMEASFDLSIDALRLFPRQPEPFLPPAESSLVVAQGLSSDGAHSWTIVTARTPQELFDGVSDLTTQANWTQLSGRLTYYDTEQANYFSLPVADPALVASIEPSFENLRLVAANWLSSRPLGYALLLALVSVLLGAVTATMTSILGRRS